MRTEHLRSSSMHVIGIPERNKKEKGKNPTEVKKYIYIFENKLTKNLQI